MYELSIYDFADVDRFSLIDSETTVPGAVRRSLRQQGDRRFLWLDYLPAATEGARTGGGEVRRIALRLPPEAVTGSITALLLDALGSRGAFTALVQVLDDHQTVRELSFEPCTPASPRILRCNVPDVQRRDTHLEFHRLIIEPNQPFAPLEFGLQRLVAVGQLRQIATGLASGSRKLGPA